MRSSSLFRSIETVCLVVSGVLLVLMALLMNTEVVARYFFGGSTQISEEYSEYILSTISLLCFIPALRRGRFLQVQSVLRLLPLRAQALLELLAGLTGAALCLVLTYGTAVLALNSYRFGSVSVQFSQTPLVVPQALLPVCLAVLTLAFVEQGLSRARILWGGHPIAQDDHVVD